MTEDSQQPRKKKLRLSRHTPEEEKGEERAGEKEPPSGPASQTEAIKPGKSSSVEPSSENPSNNETSADKENAGLRSESDAEPKPDDKSHGPTTNASPSSVSGPENGPSDATRPLPRSANDPSETRGQEDPKSGAPSGNAKASATRSDGDLPSPTTGNNLFTSIIVIGLLFLILGAAGGGLYLVLKTDVDEKTAEVSDSSGANATSSASETTKAEEPTEAGKNKKENSSGPIQKTRDVIAQILEAERGGIEENDPGTKAPEKDQEQPDTTSSAALGTAENGGASKGDAKSGAELPDLPDSGMAAKIRSEATELLKYADVGAVRSGENARVMLNGEYYRAGDLVDKDTGLVFKGIKGEKLLFQDRNEIYYLKSF